MGWNPRDLIAIDTFDEWRPFLLAAREARLQEVPWALDPLEFRFIGQIIRAKRGPLSTYVHVPTGGDLTVDADGLPHQVRVDRAMRIRTKPIGMRAAVWRSGVPTAHLSREPVHRATHEGWDTCEECQAWLDAEDARLRPRRRRAAAIGAPRSGPIPATQGGEAEARHLRVVR